MSEWPRAPLKEILRPIRRVEAPVANRTYRQLGVRLWGQGAYERDQLDGAATRYTTLNRVAADDVVVNKIWARNGSVAVVPVALDGSFVSAEFPLFTIDRSRADPRWLGWLSRWPEFWHRCDLAARGTSGKNRIRPEQFLEIEVPVPRIDQQRTLANRLSQASALLDLVRAQRDEALDTQRRLLGLMVGQHDWPLVEVPALLSRLGLQNGKSARLLEGSPVQCLTLDALQGGAISAAHRKPVALSLLEAAPYAISGGDVYVMRGSGSSERVGIAGLVPWSWTLDPASPVVFPDLLIRVALDRDLITPEYFVTVWNSSLVRSQLKPRTTSGQWKVSQADIAAVRIPVPSSAMQRRVVDSVAAVRERTDRAANLHRANQALGSRLLVQAMNAVFGSQIRR